MIERRRDEDNTWEHLVDAAGKPFYIDPARSGLVIIGLADYELSTAGHIRGCIDNTSFRLVLFG
jgi:hypothetical protein